MGLGNVFLGGIASMGHMDVRAVESTRRGMMHHLLGFA